MKCRPDLAAPFLETLVFDAAREPGASRVRMIAQDPEALLLGLNPFARGGAGTNAAPARFY